MANESGAIKAGRAFVELFADDSKLVRGLNVAKAKLKTFGAGVRTLGLQTLAVGGLITAPFLAAANIFADTGSSLHDMSARTGASVEALSALSYAAKQTGTDMGTVELAIRKMQKVLAGTGTGGTPDEQLAAIAEQINAIKDPAEKAARAMEIFGRGGTKLIPMLEELAENTKRAKELGLVMSGADADAADTLGDRMDDLYAVLHRVNELIGAALAPVLTSVAEKIVGVFVSVNEWVDQNRELIRSVFKIAAYVAAAGAAIVVLGTVITGVGVALGGLGTILATVSAGFGIMLTIVGAILSPIGLLITGVVALGSYLLYSTGLGGKALAWLGSKFQELFAFATETFNGIKDALMAGDIQLAGRILWLALKLAWENGTSKLREIWIDFSTNFIEFVAGTWAGVLAAGEIAWHAMRIAWIEGTSALKKVWATFAAWHKQASEGVADAMVSAWIWAREKTGAIDAEEAARERVYSQKQHEDATGKIDEEKKSAIAAAEADRAGGRSAESKRSDSALAGIGTDYLKSVAEAEARRGSRHSQAEEDLKKAREEYHAATEDARIQREVREGMLSEGTGNDVPTARKVDMFAGIGDVIKQKIGVAGSFNAFAAAGLGAGGVSDRLLNANEQTARNTKKLLDKLDAAEFE